MKKMKMILVTKLIFLKEKNYYIRWGPNRIGQGIEFDYCCVHAAFALSSQNYETIMINCNPEISVY